MSRSKGDGERRGVGGTPDAPIEGEVLPKLGPNETDDLVAAVEGEKPKMTIIEWSVQQILSQHRICRFRGKAKLLELEPYPHYSTLSKDDFKDVAYPILGGVTRSKINDSYDYLPSKVPDLTANDHLILFGLPDPSDGAYADAGYYHRDAVSRVWDCERLEWLELTPELEQQTVWRSPYGVIDYDQPVAFVMQLAGGDRGLYDDIMQSLAPMVMAKKPDGVIWWVGEGANGKSTLMDAFYRIFPGQLASLTVKALTDARDASFLNGNLANIVKESSEGRIEDTGIYKAVGTHEDFRIHRFHSQETELVRGNMHHIFSANNIPTFNDKGFSARRRTFIVPFTQRFASDPTFEDRTFTPEMFGHLIHEMCRYAQQIKAQQYRFKWSAITSGAKLEYDADANNSEVFARELVQGGVVAFDSFNQIRIDYENWCADEGFVPLGVTNMRRAVLNAGFTRQSARGDDESVKKIYMLPTAKPNDLQKISPGRPGLYTMPGFVPQDDPEPQVPSFSEPAEDDTDTTTTTTTKSIVKGW